MPTNEQGVSDALADAETFMRVYRDEDINQRVYGPCIDAHDVERAGLQCKAAIARIQWEYRPDFLEDALWRAQFFATAAARAAFRAVPGLRS
jgi:hypothetical protein